MKINDLMRTSNVKRWHIVDVSREQSVAEHSALVAYIAIDLIRNTPAVDDSVSLEAMWWALYHDAGEVILGDPPGNLKLTPGFADVYKKMAEHYTPSMCNMDVSEVAVQAVKIADLVESIRYMRRYGVGSEAAIIESNLYERLEAYANKTPYVETWGGVYEDVMYGRPTIANVEIPE
jgi:5'-deoxynucleotidase YfbR-like HD superfamily hydrolase